MSRFQLTTNVPNTIVHVGWDNPLQTLFAHVQAMGKRPTDNPVTLLWIGTLPSECLNITELENHISPWATLPAGTARDLERERDRASAPTRFQAENLNALRSFRSRS